MLSSFEIEGFRTFSSLRLDGLGHVNLITGCNNVGKTMVLEALRLHAAEGDVQVVEDLLRAREEFGTARDRSRSEARSLLDFASLFYGRPKINGQPVSLALQSTKAGGLVERLDLRVGAAYFPREGDDGGGRFIEPKPWSSAEEVAVGVGVQWCRGEEHVARAGTPTLRVGGDEGEVFLVPTARRRRSERTPFVTARGIRGDDAAAWWDAVSLTDDEARVIECLRLVTPVEKIALIQSNDRPGDRTFVLKVEHERERIPMRALGDGIVRMFWMSLALEMARERKLLLLDEIENGIHYSVLPDLWRFISRAAKRQGVQVFATTHSWDCIEAFQQAAASDDGEGVLVRLKRRGDEIVPTVFNRNELAIATRDEIEVR